MRDVPKRVLQITALLAGLYAARRYYRNWGTSKAECRTRLFGDDLVGDPVIQVTEAVWIDAPPSAVWPCLRQLGQNRPEWQQLGVGDTLYVKPKGWMGLRDGLSFHVAAISPEQSILLRLTSPKLPQALWSFHVEPHWTNHTRVLARTRVGLRHPGEILIAELARPVIALTTRWVLRGIKSRVQRQANDFATP